MACGKPVIGTDNRGHREFVENGKNGYLINENDISGAFATKIVELVSNRQLLDRLGTQAIADAQEYLDKNVKQELKTIYFDYIKI